RGRRRVRRPRCRRRPRDACARRCGVRTDYASVVAKLACLLTLAVIAVGCGLSAAKPSGPPAPGPGQIIYQGTEWSVVIDGGKASAQHLVGNAWRPAQQGTVKIRVLGPKPGSKGNPTVPQVAAALSAGDDLAESALWV